MAATFDALCLLLTTKEPQGFARSTVTIAYRRNVDSVLWPVIFNAKWYPCVKGVCAFLSPHLENALGVLWRATARLVCATFRSTTHPSAAPRSVTVPCEAWMFVPGG